MEKYRVFVDSYSQNTNLEDILARNFPLMMNKVKAGDTVLLKPNMFMTDKGFYTDTGLLTKIAETFRNMDAKVVVAERLRVINDILRESEDIYKYAEVVSFDDMAARKIMIPGATSLRQEIEIPGIIFDCDFLVGVPQFRTHAGVLMSNALKNMVGILPGFTTRVIHNVGLTEAIVDINRIRQQDMVVCDLITTIEGNYPITGTPVKRNCIILSDNALAADLVAADLAGFDPEGISYLMLAGQAGMGPCSLREVEVLKEYESMKFCCIEAGTGNKIKGSRFSYDYDSACPECKRYCNMLMELFISHGMPDTSLVVTAGPGNHDRLLEKELKSLVLIGNCMYHMRDRGIYVEGCPPRAIQGLAVMEWIENKGAVRDNYKNQCRWPDWRFQNELDD